MSSLQVGFLQDTLTLDVGCQTSSCKALTLFRRIHLILYYTFIVGFASVRWFSMTLQKKWAKVEGSWGYQRNQENKMQWHFMETEPGASEANDGVHTYLLLEPKYWKAKVHLLQLSPGSNSLIVSDSFAGRWYFVSLPSVFFIKPQGPIICGKLQHR